MSGDLVRQPTAELEATLAAKAEEVAALEAQVAERETEKRSADEVEAAEEGSEEKAEEAPAKRQEEASEGDSDFSSNEEEEEDAEMEDEEIIENGTAVAVAYGNLDGRSARKWYAAKVSGYNADTKLYTVTWKFAPRVLGGKDAKKKTFQCESSRLRVVSDDVYGGANKRGTRFVGLHRASTFVAPAKEVASDEESEEDEEGVAVGDYVAVAYGNARGAKRGKDPSAKAHNPAKYKKRFLWYAATVTNDNEDGTFQIEWKHPFSKKENDRFFDVEADKVQPITAKEFKKAKRKGNKGYGFVGIARLETKVGLTSG